MSQETRGRTASEPGNTGLIERAETLLDEAVGQAAKGSYREAANKAQEALAIDPENAVARDLLESYRRQVADDDERRRRRRSIAAAAAAIEEMVENDRLEEASAATEALAMQFGQDAPVEELRRRIGEARAEQLDLHELDAAFEAIRIPDGAQPAPRADTSGSVVGRIEEHLRHGRLDDARRALAQLESQPGNEDRARKLRTRIEEALEVAAENHREEEILIATAAIEEHIRLGHIDDAAQRLTDLAERHGSTAPVAELRQRLAEARAAAPHRAESRSAALGSASDAEAAVVGRGETASPVWQSAAEEQAGSGRSRWIAIAAVVVLVLLIAWWWSQRSTESGDAGTSIPSAAAESAPAPADAVARGVADDGDTAPAATDQVVTTSDRERDATGAPATDSRSAPTTNRPRDEQRSAAVGRAAATVPGRVVAKNVAAPPVETTRSAPENENAAVESAVPASQESSISSVPNDVPPPASASDAATEVVVEAVSAVEAPPPPSAPAEPEATSPSVSDSAATSNDVPLPAAAEAASAELEESAPAPPQALPEPVAAAEPEPVAAPPPAPAAGTGQAMLGCGEPGVVCLKALQVPTPHYPNTARARRLSANVVVMALVDERGRVIQTRVDSGSFAFFNDAAVEAAKRATFQPATRQGVPGRSWARLTFKFDQP